MVEFAFVVVLLIALLYGIITYGLILAAQATITQAAADASPGGHRGGLDRRRDGRGPGVQRHRLDEQDLRHTRDLQHHDLHLQPQSRGRHHRLCVPNGLPVERQHTSASR